MQSITEQPEKPVMPVPELQAERECPACGASARRAAARFCATCGRTLDESYLPADALRASYYLQQQRLGRQGQQSVGRPVGTAMREQRRVIAPPVSSAPGVNGASTTALAFVTYSLVPYLGILFCPGAIVMGGLGLLNWHRSPRRGGRSASYASVILGLFILCIQILLWWILYKVPQWAGQF
ncbi:MAG TPA: hypothetical protein VF658_08695 [Pyrinomonadaceae bacterium]|jgi:hypothetical protein